MVKDAYGVEAMSQGMAFCWHKMFREEREEVDDEERQGRPSTTKMCKK